MDGIERMTPPRRPDASNTVDLIGPSVQVLFHAVLVASVYLLFAGHNHPGGGFVGGLVAGAAIAMRYITGGIDEVRHLVRVKPWTVLGTGVLLATVTAGAPLMFDHPVLDAVSWDVDLPVFGHIHVSSVLPFDVGVYLVVVGLTLMMFEAFGDDYDGDGEEERLGSASAASFPRFDEVGDRSAGLRGRGTQSEVES